jgi:geranylgeranyl reductase family protein
VTPEVLVVGAGPAGSVAALLLARAGVKVRLLERGTFPRDKLCGDTLNPGAMALLEKWGLHRAVRTGALHVSGMTVTGPGGAMVAADYKGGLTGAALTRRALDAMLADAAVAAGAHLETGVTVTAPLVDDKGRVVGVRTSDRGEPRWPAPLVIAADGRASRLGAALGLVRFARRPRRWAFGAYYEGVAGMSSRGEMHIRYDGYIGVAPVPGGLANICVVRESPRVNQRHVVAETIAADELLHDRFAHASMVSPVSVLGPLAVEASAAGTAGLLLAGDAGGFVDPMTGDGLRFALRGAELAAEAALHELETGVPQFGRLAADRRSEFAGKWRVNRLLRSLVATPRAVQAASMIARVWPAPVDYLVGIAGDVDQASLAGSR